MDSFRPDWSTVIATAVLVALALNGPGWFMWCRFWYQRWVEARTLVTVECPCGQKFEGNGRTPAQDFSKHCMGEHYQGSSLYVSPEQYADRLRTASRRRV